MNQASVDPNSLKTWSGYIESATKLNDALKSQGINGIGIDCGGAEWYPYLWMLGGNILAMKNGHPTKGAYWFPAYNSTKGLQAMKFFNDQVDAGVKPIISGRYVASSFVNRTYAVFPQGSWLPEAFPPNQLSNLTKRVGFIPMYPVPKEGVDTSTLLGGWELSIAQSSKNKDLTWELITLMLKPDIIAPMLAKTGYLPTQISIGQGPFSNILNQTIPYYDKMISLIELGRARPNTPEFPQIDDHVTEALKQVCHGVKEPKQALLCKGFRMAVVVVRHILYICDIKRNDNSKACTFYFFRSSFWLTEEIARSSWRVEINLCQIIVLLWERLRGGLSVTTQQNKTKRWLVLHLLLHNLFIFR